MINTQVICRFELAQAFHVGVQVNVLLNDCYHNTTSLSLLVSTTVAYCDKTNKGLSLNILTIKTKEYIQLNLDGPCQRQTSGTDHPDKVLCQVIIELGLTICCSNKEETILCV